MLDCCNPFVASRPGTYHPLFERNYRPSTSNPSRIKHRTSGTMRRHCCKNSLFCWAEIHVPCVGCVHQVARMLHLECSESKLKFKFSAKLCDALDKCYNHWHEKYVLVPPPRLLQVRAVDSFSRSIGVGTLASRSPPTYCLSGAVCPARRTLTQKRRFALRTTTTTAGSSSLSDIISLENSSAWESATSRHKGLRREASFFFLLLDFWIERAKSVEQS